MREDSGLRWGTMTGGPMAEAPGARAPDFWTPDAGTWLPGPGYPQSVETPNRSQDRGRRDRDHWVPRPLGSLLDSG